MQTTLILITTVPTLSVSLSLFLSTRELSKSGSQQRCVLQPRTLHIPLVLVELCNLSRKRLWCQLAEKFWTLLDGMTGCLECQQRRLQNDGVCMEAAACMEWSDECCRQKAGAVQRVMSSQSLGTCGQSLWALGGLMALIGAHYTTRPSPIALHCIALCRLG